MAGIRGRDGGRAARGRRLDRRPDPVPGRPAGHLPEIDFNRPYLLLVTGTGTGEPLFMARVANPLTS